MAVSEDLIHWERPFDHPVLPVTKGAWDSKFASDPQVYWDAKEKQWVMFYFGLGNLSACEGLAVSEDLYHFYCACRPYMEGDTADNGGEFRCITVAKNAPWEE